MHTGLLAEQREDMFENSSEARRVLWNIKMIYKLNLTNPLFKITVIFDTLSKRRDHQPVAGLFILEITIWITVPCISCEVLIHVLRFRGQESEVFFGNKKYVKENLD